MNRKFIITESDRTHIKSLYEQIESTDLTSELQTLNNVLSQSNVTPIAADEIEELSPDCPVDIPQNEYQGKLSEIQEKINNINNIDVLKSELKKISTLQKQSQKPIQEQAVPIIILGVAVPPVAITIVAGTILLMLIIKLAKLIFGKKTHKTSSSCKRRSKLFKKYGVDGMFR
jgi:hypothetical protein